MDEPSWNPRSVAAARVRKLGRDATPAERHLWPHLSSRQLTGAKFRRQFPVGAYILDFADHAAKPAVELDGDTHATGDGPARDARRSEWLQNQGWRIVRFTNREVFSNLDGVLQTIESALRGHPSPQPSPTGEGEVE